MNKTMLKKSFVLFPLLSVLLLACLWLEPGTAFAASTQSHHATAAQSVVSANGCNAEYTGFVVIVTDAGGDVFCADGSGTESVALYDVFAIETGDYVLTWTWEDLAGGIHTSTKGSWTFLSARNASANFFAKSYYMYEITSITLTPSSASGGPGTCNPGDPTGFWTAGIDPSGPWVNCGGLVECSPNVTINPGLTNVIVIETGQCFLRFTWVDVNGGVHTSTKEPYTVVAAGNSPNGFAGFLSMKAITAVTHT